MRRFGLLGPFVQDEGFAFRLPLPQELQSRDSDVRIFLFEDDRLLGPADSAHADIRRIGGGRFSLWGETIYLSSSDNSDPNTNSRTYQIFALDVSQGSRLTTDVRHSIAADDEAALNILLENSQINNTVFSNFFRYNNTIMEPLRRNGIPLPKSVLELGCGKRPYTALRFLVNGVSRFIANDTMVVQRTFERELIDKLRLCLHVLDADLAERLNNVIQLSTDGDRYEAAGLTVLDQMSCEDIEIDDPVEFVTSTSVLEHVKNPRGCVDAIARGVRPGGIMLHSIDLRDHRDFSRPLAFLYQTDEQYSEKTENRYRASDWLTLFKHAGLDLVEADRLILCANQQAVWTREPQYLQLGVTNAERKSLASPFNEYELIDLSTIALKVLFRKPY